MKEYIITHEQLERLFGWIDQLTLLVHGEEAEPFIGKRLALYEQLEVPPVVRCKDCKYFNDYHGKCDRPVLVINGIDTFWTDDKDDGNVYVTNADPNGFCAWGERVEGSEA